jgi:hypothetical protein
MRRFFIPLTAAALLLPVTVSAQAVSTHSAADAAAEARINAAIQTALEAGVPQVLLENKVAEGRAKGVAAARIAAAVEHRAEVLTRVNAALQAGVPPRADAGTDARARSGGRANANANANANVELFSAAELTAAADAHEAGVSLENLVRLSARAGEQRGTALSVLAELVAAGRVPEQALLNVQAALNRGGNALVDLRGTVGAGARPAAVPATPRGRPGAGAGAAATGVVRVGGGN